MSRESASGDALALEVARLGKKFRLGGTAATTFREALTQMMRRAIGQGPGRAHEFWALRDISFSVRPGEVVGIVGRNGAGKSTLLKLLSRIIEPTEGRALIRGRVGSLLEVGTGFHSELTGRENVFLSGAVLGMRRHEIEDRFDEIVSYAEIGQFLDTPVKHYSSGMYMRLAFSVAAHLRPEVLVVDEVLAVGDAAFQRKCLGTMSSVARSGRTVLFVSHNLAAVRTLCSRVLLLEDGRLTHDGPVETVLAQYEASGGSRSSSWVLSSERVGTKICRIDCTLEGAQPTHTLKLDVLVDTANESGAAFLAVDITDVLGTPLLQSIPRKEPFLRAGARQQLSLRIDLPALVPGFYSAGVWVGPHFSETYDWVPRAVSFEVVDSPTQGRTFPHSPDHGFMVADSQIEAEF